MARRTSGDNKMESPRHDFLFTWKSQHWPYDNVRKLIETFRSAGTVEEPWSCAAHKKIGSGDRAYLLKQGRPIGIWGRGTVVGTPKRRPRPNPGDSQYQVLLGFDVSRGDVLWDPEDQFLVDEKQLLNLPVPKKQWQNQSSGITLDATAARAIDSILFDSIQIGPMRATSVDETAYEVARRSKLVEQLTRPNQQFFSQAIRKNYRYRCAVTGCSTDAALEAAHIRTQKNSDDNHPANGILLRADIHALFDRLLITLSEDSTRLEVSPELSDPSYTSLKQARVTLPKDGPAPSVENIRDHRYRFFERLRRRASDTSGKAKPSR